MMREVPQGREKRMRTVRRVIPVAVSLAVVSLVTAILWYLKLAGDGLHHPVFFYLLPIALLAMFYGSAPALLCASAATACAAYFLYEPLYSFHVANRLEVGDLICFAVLALIGVKCTGELLRPPAKAPAVNRAFQAMKPREVAIRTRMPADPSP
jgi:K+-sensing histidine kinase KdpD